MHLRIFLFLAQYIICTSAGVYNLDPSCSRIKRGDGSTFDATQATRDSIREAIGTVEIAHSVLEEHMNDQGVQAICNTVLGGDAVRIAQAKASLNGMKTWSKDAFSFAPDDPQWRQQRTNQDVEIYCDWDRFIVIPDQDDAAKSNLIDTTRDRQTKPNGFFKYWTNLYNINVRTAKSVTWDSDLFDMNHWAATEGRDRGRSKKEAKYSTPRPHLPAMTDLEPGYMASVLGYDNPQLNEDTVKIYTGEEYVARFMAEPTGTALRTPVDAMQNLAHTLLHELTHTIAGGFLDDLPSKDLCYGWKCIQIEKNPRNADTIAWLAFALKLWSMGYMVNEEGQVSKFR